MDKLDSANKRSISELLTNLTQDPLISRTNGPANFARYEQDHDHTIAVRYDVDATASSNNPNTQLSIQTDQDITPEAFQIEFHNINQHLSKDAVTYVEIYLNVGVDCELGRSLCTLDALATDQRELNQPTAIRLTHDDNEDSITVFHGPQTDGYNRAIATKTIRRYVDGKPVYYVQQSSQKEVLLDKNAPNPFIEIAEETEKVIMKTREDIQQKTPNATELQDFLHRRFLQEASDASRANQTFDFLETTQIIKNTKAIEPISSFIKFPFRH